MRATSRELRVGSGTARGMLLVLAMSALVAMAGAAEWESLFDGKSLDGWRASEKPGTFSVQDGAIVVKGPRSHLYYVGAVGNHDFQDFELCLEVKTWPKANSGIYIHTQWQESGWPTNGYEVQVNNSGRDEQRTGGLYAVSKNLERVADDGRWFTMHIRVIGKRVVVKVDDRVVTDHLEPPDWAPPDDFSGRRISRGTICLQGHDAGSEVHYRNLRIRRLPR